jgi:hypothetical protein
MVLDIILAVISIVTSVIQQRKQRKAQKKAEAEADERKGFQLTIKGESSPIPIVYGRQMVGGILADVITQHDHIYAATPGADSTWLSNSRFTVGTNLDYKDRKHRNRFLIGQYAICQGEIEEVKYIQVDDLPYNDKEFTRAQDEEGGHIIVQYNNGGTACPLATANGMLSTNKFTDLAFCTTSFWLDRDNPQYYQIPDLKFYVKGKKIPQVVDAGGGNYTYNRAGTLTYTNNPALVLLDYMTGDYGMGLDNSEIDLESFYNAAVTCAQTVNPAAGLGTVERRGYIWQGNSASYTNTPLYGRTIGGNNYISIFLPKNQISVEDVSTIQANLAAAGYVGQIVHEDGGHYDIDFTNSTYDIGNDEIQVPLTEVTEVDGAPTMDTAADIEEIQLSAMIDKINTQPDTLPLYECNITIDPSLPVRENIQDILNSMPNADLIWSEGKFKLQLGYWTSQAALKAEAESNLIVTDDILKNSQIKTTYPNKDIKLNEASVRYLDEQDNFKAKTQTWPEKNGAVSTTYLSEDNGVVLNAQLDGAGYTDPYHARALAEQTVRESRRAVQYEFECFSEAYNFEPGDVIKLNSVINSLTSDDDIMRVDRVELTELLTVKVSGTRINSSDFAWNITDEIVSPYDRHISFEIFPPTLTNTEISEANIDNPTSYGYRVLPTESAVFLRFEVSNSNAFDYYEIEWAKSNSTDDDDWFIAGRTKNEQFTMNIGEPEEDVYIRARSVSQTGKRSDPSEVVIGPVNVVTAAASAWSFAWDIQNISWVEQSGGGYTSPDATARLEAFIGAQEMTRIDYTGDTNDLGDFEWWVSSVSNTGTFTRSDTAYTLGQNYFETTTSNFSASGIISVTLQLKLPGYAVFTTTRKLAVTGVEIGTNGANVNIIFQRSVSAPSTPAPSTGIPAGWADTPSGTTGTDTLWASQGTTPVDSDTYTWDTPFQIEGNATAEVYIYRKNDNTQPTGGSYNFTNSTLTNPTPTGVDGWDDSIPALTSNGDTVYVSVGLFVGSNIETAATTTWSSPTIYAQRTDGLAGAPGAPGAAGANAVTVKLTATQYFIDYDKDGDLNSPTSITLTATAQNVSNGYFKFTGDGFSDEVSFTDGATATTDTFVFTVPDPDSGPYTIRVGVADGDQVELAYDTIEIASLSPNNITAYLTNESHSIPTDDTGVGDTLAAGNSYLGAQGIFQLFDGSTNKRSESAVTYSIVSTATQDGLTMNMTSPGGTYWVTGTPTATTAPITWTLRATYGGVNYDKDFTLTKSLEGVAGLNQATVEIFKKSTSSGGAVTKPIGNTTYTFADGSVVFSDAQGWSTTAPNVDATEKYLYKRTAPAIGVGTTATIADTEWSSGSLISSWGAQGDPGDIGLKTKTGFVYYQLTGDPGANPTATSYTFSTGAFVGLTSNWSTTPPAISGDSYYAAKYEVTESASGSNTGSPSFSGRFQNFNFTSLVTFTDLSTSGATTIHGDNITTGVIESTDYSYTSGNFSNAGTAIYLNGNGVIRSQNFNVDSSGNLRLKGSVICSSAAISGWTFEANGMYIGTGQDAYEFNGQSGISMGNNATYGAYITHPNFYVMTALSGTPSYPQVGIKGGTMSQSGGSITGSGIWLRKRDILATSGTDAAYDFAVGDKSGDYLEWKGKEGTLTVGGDIIATGNIKASNITNSLMADDSVDTAELFDNAATAGNADATIFTSLLDDSGTYEDVFSFSMDVEATGTTLIYWWVMEVEASTVTANTMMVRISEGSPGSNAQYSPALTVPLTKRTVSYMGTFTSSGSGTRTFYCHARPISNVNDITVNSGCFTIIQLKR